MTDWTERRAKCDYHVLEDTFPHPLGRAMFPACTTCVPDPTTIGGSRQQEEGRRRTTEASKDYGNAMAKSKLSPLERGERSLDREEGRQGIATGLFTAEELHKGYSTSFPCHYPLAPRGRVLERTHSSCMHNIPQRATLHHLRATVYPASSTPPSSRRHSYAPRPARQGSDRRTLKPLPPASVTRITGAVSRDSMPLWTLSRRPRGVHHLRVLLGAGGGSETACGPPMPRLRRPPAHTRARPSTVGAFLLPGLGLE